MTKHQNLLVFVTILLLAIIIQLAKMQKHSGLVSKHYGAAPINTCITAAYGPHVDKGANLLDLYLPEQSLLSPISNKGSYPLIVFIHGGAWQSGDKSMVPNPSEFTRRGYVLASINYRLSGEAPHPAQIEDCKTAINWLRAHAKVFKIDSNHIGVWGISAGGHLAAFLGTTCSATTPPWAAPGGLPCAIQAVCDWCGPTDLTTLANQAGAHYVLAQAVQLFTRGTPESELQAFKAASPITYVRPGLPPFLIMHGDKDTIVPAQQSQELSKALKVAKVNTDLQIIPGAQHMFADPHTMNIVFHFFDTVLKR